MNMRMKAQQNYFLLPLSILFLSFLSTTSFVVKANAPNGKIKPIKVVDIEMKCYVELMGGGESIQFTNTPYESLEDLTQVLMGRKVKLVGDKVAKPIYKIKECVPLADKFKSKRAQALLLNTPL